MPEIRELLYLARRCWRRDGRNFARRACKDKFRAAGSILYLSAFLSTGMRSRKAVATFGSIIIQQPARKLDTSRANATALSLCPLRERPRRRSGQGEPGEGTGLLSGSLLN